ncbi:MAG: hypothetical protein EOO12_01435 [Chitinophagaceae bacterium]|nr:MAG: hypothetical protein EOO12_01435 [Chitinophagaceae bacterium]
MRNEKCFFGNLLTSAGAPQLQKYGRSSVARLEPDFPEKAALLRPKLVAFEEEEGLTGSAEVSKQGHVASADDQLKAFKKYIKIAEGAIRYAAGEGWKKAELYRDFFPNGLTEYTLVNKTSMSDMAERLRLGAVKHAVKLPVELAERLQAIKSNWDTAFAQQESGKEHVQEKKIVTGAARTAFEKALLTAMHEVAALYPGDVKACTRYFELRLLKAYSRSEADAIAAPAAAAPAAAQA